jgi:hypothetical protein
MSQDKQESLEALQNLEANAKNNKDKIGLIFLSEQ